MVTHDVQEAFEMADLVCLMDKGNIIQMGTPADLLFRPAHQFVTDFFAQQSFLLGLQTLTLKDLGQHLQNITGTHNLHYIEPTTDLLGVFQLLSSANNGRLLYYTMINGHQKSVTLQDVLSGYSSVKNEMSHE